MLLTFLKREQKKSEIEWGITPYYLMATRDSHPTLWSKFVGMVNSIDDHSLDRAMDKAHKERKKKEKGGKK